MVRTIREVLEIGLSHNPRATALVSRSGTLTYSDLDHAARRAEGMLWKLGLRPGDRLAVSLPNDLDIVVAFFGTMRLGAVWVGINQALAVPEKAAIIVDSGSVLILGDARTIETLAPIQEQLPKLRRMVVVEADDSSSEWGRRLAVAAPAPELTVNGTAPAAIAYTSGTTGRPKGVVHSQEGLLLPGAVLVASRRYDHSLRKGDCLPMTILNLLVLGPLLAAQAAGCCVVMDRRDPEGIAEWIRVTAVTVWNGVPAMLHDLIESDSVQQRDLKTLREVWTGGSSCPTSIYEGFVEKFSVFPTSTYGLTEAPTIVSMDPIAGQHVAGSSGVALPHLRVAVLDAHGRELQEGQDGEICVQAMRSGPWTAVYQPMLGYWNKPAETAETLAGGYLHTGDIGRVDGQGQLFVVDRKNNLIVRGGANVYPAEVERVIKSLEGVRESVVLGVPDDRLGERVVAVIEGGAGSHLTAGMIASFCAQNLAKYKCPEEIRLVDALPRNAMGKIQRDAAAALFR